MLYIIILGGGSFIVTFRYFLKGFYLKAILQCGIIRIQIESCHARVVLRNAGQAWSVLLVLENVIRMKFGSDGSSNTNAAIQIRWLIIRHPLSFYLSYESSCMEHNVSSNLRNKS